MSLERKAKSEQRILMADVTLTVDGKKLTVPAGTLLIEACKSTGIEVPSFCYYPGLSLQGACRMCLVEVEKMPKLQTALATRIAHRAVERMVAEQQLQHGLAARQPSARLPGVRCGWRVRTAGHDLQVRRGRIEVHRAEEPSRRAAMVARGVL